MKPVRLQLSRRKGFDLQGISRAANGLPAINVARPSKWGNPFEVGMTEHLGIPFCGGPLTVAEAVVLFRGTIGSKLNDFPNCLEELWGKNLACWCKPGEPCHADVLLELSNR